jgi:hypothetical protein
MMKHADLKGQEKDLDLHREPGAEEITEE